MASLKAEEYECAIVEAAMKADYEKVKRLTRDLVAKINITYIPTPTHEEEKRLKEEGTVVLLLGNLVGQFNITPTHEEEKRLKRLIRELVGEIKNIPERPLPPYITTTDHEMND